KWNPQPPNEEMVTSGPFNVSEYVAGEFTELTYNPNYFYAPEHPSTGTETTTETTTTEGNLMLAVVAGAVGAAVVILVGGYVLMRQR
ncbi:MAG: hypothetical protein ACTSPX_02305, partial [Candidatus Thorarchaeota archaeon]